MLHALLARQAELRMGMQAFVRQAATHISCRFVIRWTAVAAVLSKLVMLPEG